ncbi:hydrogenase maturation protein [Scytonema tolypothrichoides VB-61278]|nr:hydrogenase maturation protein [Scytonema tolypothrichoides VB-61278]
MKILFLVTAYNSLTQRAHIEVTNRGHEVSIELAVSDKVMAEAVELYKPDLIIAPMLKTAIPENIWQHHLCIIIHPGIMGDRGPSSLDWAIMINADNWGVTALQARAEMDTGDIWSSQTFKMRQCSKSCLYRAEVTEAAIKVILETIERFQSRNFVPQPLDYGQEDVKGCLRPYMRQNVRAIDWASESVSDIIRKIRAADSQPGVLDTIYGEEYYLYGAHEEDTLKGFPGEIIAQRYGAICRAACDGAVWISHLKKKKKENQLFFKLPAALVLSEHLKNLPELRLSLQVSSTDRTYKEIWYEEKNNVGYLHFDFSNGAMSTDQCQRLRDAFLDVCTRETKVIVLMGGYDFWSNGIHLNVIEAAQDPREESWRNINAMNDLVYAILTTNTHLVIAALQGNAAAGGVMLALAADIVYCRRGIVLNPHYKRMGLYGSEYWTYSLPKRVGMKKAIELTDNCMPMGTEFAKKIGLIDDYLGSHHIIFQQQIELIAEEMATSPDYDNRLTLKIQNRLKDEQYKPLEDYRKEELEQMKINFYEPGQSYHTARYNFVYKVPPLETPLHLAKHRQVGRNLEKCALFPFE